MELGTLALFAEGTECKGSQGESKTPGKGVGFKGLEAGLGSFDLGQ